MLFLEWLFARLDFVGWNAFNNNILAFQFNKHVDLFRGYRLVQLYFAGANRSPCLRKSTVFGLSKI